MKSSHRDTPLYVPAPADRPPCRRETEHRLESDISEDERAAAREWLPRTVGAHASRIRFLPSFCFSSSLPTSRAFVITNV